MDLAASRELFNIVTRQSLYIEQVKLDEIQRFNFVLSEAEKELSKVLARLKYDNLDALTKAQLAVFLKELRVSQSKIYSRYQLQMIKRLQEFMSASVIQTAQVSASFHSHDFEEMENEEEIKLLSFAKSLEVIESASKENEGSNLYGFAFLLTKSDGFPALWSRVTNTPMPSGGQLPLAYISTALATALVNVENTVKSAWVNKLTIAQLRAELFGGIVAGVASTGTLPRFGNAMRSVIPTTMQHVAQQAVGAVNSLIWPEYVWVSIIDDVTSDICRERNNKTWPYGKGPLPPAHNRCRSHILPFDYYNPAFVMPTFYEWLLQQPESFISSVFGSTIAAKFKAGTIRRADFEKFKPVNSKTVAEFLKSTGDLI